MRVLWSGLILLCFLLSNAEATVVSPLPHPKIAAGQVGGGIRNHCSDSALSLKSSVVHIQSLMRDSYQTKTFEKEFTRHLAIKTKCALEVMLSVLGSDFRMSTLNSKNGEKLQGALQRLRNDYEVLAPAHPTAKAMLILIDHIRAEALRAEAEADYLTLREYFSERMAELEALSGSSI